MTRPPRPWLSAALPRDPLGPVTPTDGHDPAALRRWCADGALVWVAADVYLPADVAGTRRARRLALAALAPAGAVVTGAAAVWGRGGPGLPARRPDLPTAAPSRVEVLVRTGSRPRRTAPQVRVRQSDLLAAQVEDVDGLLVTAVDRCAADLARWGRGPEDDAALRWLWQHGASVHRAAAVLRAEVRAPGNRQARLVLSAVRRGHPLPLTELTGDGRRAG